MNTLLTVALLMILGTFLFLGVTIISLVILLIIAIKNDKKQVQHSILRNFPFLGKIRYISEHIAPELRQYFFECDEEGKPYSKNDFQAVVKAGKYLKTIIAFGSKRDFEKPGYYIKNAMFPLQIDELKVDNINPINSKKYTIDKDKLWKRDEHLEAINAKPWLLNDKDAIVIGENSCQNPFVVKSLIGMSGMSYGALGDHAITALSKGIGMTNSFMNTGEGGLSPYHLEGGCDIVCQIGPGLFGFVDKKGEFSYEKLKNVSNIEQVKAFELKLGQGAKIRGGHVEGSKVTEEIAQIRGVEPWKTIDSPNRFKEFSNSKTLLEFITSIRNVSQKPVGIKIVVGGNDSLDDLCETIVATGMHPDFISVDGGEGGTGATYKSMADSIGLPIKPAIMIVHDTLKKFNLRENIKIIASGKLFLPDKIAISLSMGADLVQVARAMMISVGCIGAQKCHSNDCPVGVATTDKKLQQALVIDEKKYRVANYIITIREELFALAAATGLSTPKNFNETNITYNDEQCNVSELKDIKLKNIS